MFRFDIRTATSYAAAVTVTLFATTMLFAATAVPAVSAIAGAAV